MPDERKPPVTLRVAVNAHVKADAGTRLATFPAAHPLMIEEYAVVIPMALIKQLMGTWLTAEGNGEAEAIKKAIAERNGGTVR